MARFPESCSAKACGTWTPGAQIVRLGSRNSGIPQSVSVHGQMTPFVLQSCCLSRRRQGIMARRGRKRSTVRGKGSQSASALRRNGQRAFDRSDYAGAIAAWEQAVQRTSQARHETRLAPALAESYFRRGLNQLYGRSRDPEAGLSDFSTVV